MTHCAADREQGYGHMQGREGGRERRGCQNMLKTTPKPRNNGLRTCTFSPHHDSSPKANTTRASQASRPATAGGWMDSKNSVLVAPSSVRACGGMTSVRVGVNRHFMFSVPNFSPRSVGKSDAVMPAWPRHATVNATLERRPFQD